MAHYLFTSESVTEGHPDKMCDQISDAILDEILKQDPKAHVACEVTAAPNVINIMGEISTTADIDVEKTARDVICSIGYDSADSGFDGKNCVIISTLNKQSPDIAMGVNASFEYRDGEDDKLNRTGAGDQGIMFGYACDETPELMPLPISLAHKLAIQLTKVRKDGTIKYLRPDGKTQVTVEYDDNGKPVRLDTVLISTQHAETADIDTIRADLKKYVIDTVIPSELMDSETKILVNPTGRFVIGTYGGYSRHGGGAFSGKDPTKVDRSAAYAARYAAKNIVAAGLAKKCEIQLSYAIGVAKPVSVMIDTFGTGIVSDEIIAKAVDTVFDLRPAAIIKTLGLDKPIYRALAAYGHMGREDLGVSWEKTDKTELLRSQIADLK